MGQTLTHGVYLPDEGERNCYSGLAANWQILDTSVGTIAAHTAALAGKAPLVHTHTVSQITDFPAYGNAAGTICEGNDSRLSDARTPVAHTHTKSDVTDLLNSNFIPSANNSYDLGSSSYQWNNLYAKNYYYNGTEFQNKFVTLDTDQLITGLKRLKSGWWRLQAVNLQVGAGEQYGRNGYTLVWTDKDDITICDIASYKQSRAARTYLRLRGGDYYTGGVPDAQGTLVQSELRIGTLANGTRMIECATDAVYSTTDNATDLGTSSKKWKSFNGINPGALSLPVTALNNTYDISGNITDLTGGNNSITAARTGWIFVKSDNATEISIENTTTGMGASDHSANAATLMVSVPVTSGESVNIIANCTSIDKAYLLPCQGNV